MCFVYFIALVAVVKALPSPDVRDSEPITSTQEAPKIVRKECIGGIFSPTCLKIEAISMIEKMNSKEELQLLPGISIIKETNGKNHTRSEDLAAEFARALPTKPDERLDKYLLFTLGNYLDTHMVKLRLLDDNAAEEAKALVGEARAKGGFGGGKKGGMGGLLAAGLLMKGMLQPKL